ncbi:MAG: hypothetical protein JNK26_00195 [Candidatus Doudnabacteria bacterium]|nr:hypothetical protein [Candidatus Doudnabacteria bacterium]
MKNIINLDVYVFSNEQARQAIALLEYVSGEILQQWQDSISSVIDVPQEERNAVATQIEFDDIELGGQLFNLLNIAQKLLLVQEVVRFVTNSTPIPPEFGEINLKALKNDFIVRLSQTFQVEIDALEMGLSALQLKTDYGVVLAANEDKDVGMLRYLQKWRSKLVVILCIENGGYYVPSPFFKRLATLSISGEAEVTAPEGDDGGYLTKLMQNFSWDDLIKDLANSFKSKEAQKASSRINDLIALLNWRGLNRNKFLRNIGDRLSREGRVAVRYLRAKKNVTNDKLFQGFLVELVLSSFGSEIAKDVREELENYFKSISQLES